MKAQDGTAGWRLQLLGAPMLAGEGAQVKLDRKMAGVLAYVALSGPTPRAPLRALLWPDVPAERARNGFRQTLHRLRGAGPPELLRAARS